MRTSVRRAPAVRAAGVARGTVAVTRRGAAVPGIRAVPGFWAVLVCGAVLAAGGVAGAGTASAAPPDPVTVSVQQVGDAALYQSGLQVYEVAAARPAENTYPPTEELVMRRVRSSDDGIPGAPRFAFVGAPLPEAFVVAQAWERPGVPSGLLMPADPETLEEYPVSSDLTMVSVLSGPAGPFAGAGVSTPYLG